MQYSHSEVNFYNDTDLEPLAWWHPRIENTVYAGMDWFCPFYQHSLYNQLSLYHGTLTPELSVMNVTAAVMTGDLHAAVYDLTDGLMFVANHAPSWVKDPQQKAYQRPFVRFNMSQLFAKTVRSELKPKQTGNETKRPKMCTFISRYQTTNLIKSSTLLT